MKKILSIALILGATALMACPGKSGGMMCGDKGGCGGLIQKCECDTKKLPPMMEKLNLSDKQKEQVIKIRQETQAYRNKQHEKMLGVLTAEQRSKLEGMQLMMGEKKGGKMCKGEMKESGRLEGGQGCKTNCDKE
jgi:Spy/CpxP family protein refolding chaperone